METKTLPQLLLFNNHLSLLERMCGCVIIILHQKNQKGHYESSGWHHYTCCLHSNCPLNIVLLQQHVFIISEHPNGSNIIWARFNGIVVLCSGLSDKGRATNGLLISLQVTKKRCENKNMTLRLCRCLIQSHYQYVVTEGEIPHNTNIL